MMFICGKVKVDFLTSNAKSPTGEIWMINSMNEIGENFMFYGGAVEIRDAVKYNNSNSENKAELFEIKSILLRLGGALCMT